jgi:hypothetical protein
MRIPAACRYILIDEIGGVMDHPTFYETEEAAQHAIAFFHANHDPHEDGYANITVIDLGRTVPNIRFYTESNETGEAN